MEYIKQKRARLRSFESPALEIKFADEPLYLLSFAALDKARTSVEIKDTRPATFVPADLSAYAELLGRIVNTLYLFPGALAVWSISSGQCWSERLCALICYLERVVA